MTVRRIARVAGRVLVALVSASTLAVAGVAWGAGQQAGAVIVTSKAVAAPPVDPGQPFTALLVGLDARTDANGNPLPQALLDALHAGPDEGQLHTDTMILVHVPASADEKAVAISIPRDSYVDLADGTGKHKINSAYGRGVTAAEKSLAQAGLTPAQLDRQGREAGRAALIATIERFTGARIDHYAEINLAGFVELTDAIGGVPVCLKARARDDYSGVDLPAGYQTISGPAALAFVRQRHGLNGGDLDRIARQQAFASGLAQRLRASGTLTDPAALRSLLQVASRHVVIDQGWDVMQALTQLGRLAGDDLTFATIPTGRPDLRTPYDGVAVQVDPAAVRAFVTAQLAQPTAVTPAASPTPAAPTTAPITAGGVPCVN